MNDEEHNKKQVERLTAYLKKIFKTDSLEEVHGGLESAIKNAPKNPLENLEVGRVSTNERSPLETLEVLIKNPRGNDLSGMELLGLEAIINTCGKRPAINIRKGSFDLADVIHEWQFLNDHKATIDSAIQSVGRIEAPHVLTAPYVGTGFVVGDSLIMTNRHVARAFTDGTGTNELNFFAGAAAGVDFNREYGARAQVLTVDQVVMVHPYWDMALLKTNEKLDIPPVRLSAKDLVDVTESNNKPKVVVIGYPGKDNRGDRGVREEIFDGYYGIKRLLPGDYDGPVKFRGLDVMAHDTSTLGGSSGSLVLDIESGEVIGLHYAGLYLKSNYAVPTSYMAEDARIAEFAPKLNFSGARKPNPKIFQIWDQFERGELASPEEPTQEENAEEFLFRVRTPNPNTFLNLFDLNSFTSPDFNWKTTLATALASYVAYEDETKVQTICQQWGFPKCQFIERADTQCFVAGNSEFALISFRGTKAIRDWLINLNTISFARDYGRIHRGFWFAFESVSKLIHEAIDQLGTPKVIITGHSLGGALAVVAAAEWIHNKKHDVQSVYTFGQPAVGNKTFAEYLNSNLNNYQRVVNDDDLVPMVPPHFRHAGELKHFGPSHDLKSKRTTTSTNETLIETGETCTELQLDHLRIQFLQDRLMHPEYREEYREENNEDEKSAEEGLLPSIRDHSMAWYIQKIAAHI